MIEESKGVNDPLLSSAPSDQGEVVFTTKKNDPNHMHIKGNPISILALNITSFMGGRAVPWPRSDGRLGLYNPYQKGAASDHNNSKKL